MDVVAVHAEVAARTQGLATHATLRASGLSSTALTRAVRAGDLVRVRPGVYARSPLPASPVHLVGPEGPHPHHVARVRADLLAAGQRAWVRGPTAATLHGLPLLVEPRASVHLGVPHGSGRRRPPASVQVAQAREPRLDLLRPVPGAAPLLVTTPTATAIDLARSLPFAEAVVAVDSALRGGRLAVDELVPAARDLSGLPGADAVRRVIAAADPLAGSVLESVARLDLLRDGAGGFVTQMVVRAGHRALRVDFCWPDRGLVLEVDGARWHPDPARDQERDNTLVGLGWRVLRLSWSQVMGDPRWTDRVLSALRAGAARVA